MRACLKIVEPDPTMCVFVCLFVCGLPLKQPKKRHPQQRKRGLEVALIMPFSLPRPKCKWDFPLVPLQTAQLGVPSLNKRLLFPPHRSTDLGGGPRRPRLRGSAISACEKAGEWQMGLALLDQLCHEERVGGAGVGRWVGWVESVGG